MRRTLFPVILSALFFGAMLAYLFSGTPPSSESTQTAPDKQIVTETRTKVRDITPDDFLQPPSSEETVLERLPAIEPPPPPKRPPKPNIWKRPIVISAGVFKSNETEIRLAGIKPLPVNQLCNDQTGKEWPCGKFAKTAFNNFVRSRSITCAPTDDESDKIKTNCTLGDRDLGAWLVENGWAHALGNSYRQEQTIAEQELRGIWRNSNR